MAPLRGAAGAAELLRSPAGPKTKSRGGRFSLETRPKSDQKVARAAKWLHNLGKVTSPVGRLIPYARSDSVCTEWLRSVDNPVLRTPKNMLNPWVSCILGSSMVAAKIPECGFSPHYGKKQKHKARRFCHPIPGPGGNFGPEKNARARRKKPPPRNFIKKFAKRATGFFQGV